MEIAEVKKIWDDVKEELISTIPPSSFEPWILPLEPIGFENNEFSMLTGHAFAISIIRKNHYQQIIEAFKKVLGKEGEGQGVRHFPGSRNDLYGCGCRTSDKDC